LQKARGVNGGDETGGTFGPAPDATKRTEGEKKGGEKE